MGFLDPDTVINQAFGTSIAGALQTVGSEVTQDMVNYTKLAANDFYSSWHPKRYQRAGDLAKVGKPVGPTMTGKYSVHCGAEADSGAVTSKPAYQWGRVVYGNRMVPGGEIFDTAWNQGMHGAWYTAATTQSPDITMAQYMIVQYGKIGSYLSALLG